MNRIHASPFIIYSFATVFYASHHMHIYKDRVAYIPDLWLGGTVERKDMRVARPKNLVTKRVA